MGRLCHLLLLFVLVVALVAVIGQRGNCGHHWCMCSRKQKMAICKDHGRKLTYIPILPEYVTKLDFSSNYLPHISTRTLHNISSLRLLELNITYSEVERISSDAFSTFSHLKVLSLNGNNISLETLAGTFPSLENLQVSTLSLESMFWTSTALFRQLHSHSLQTLVLDRNSLTIYNHSDFQHLHMLETLSIGHNNIHLLYLGYLRTLENLNLRANQIATFPNFCNYNGSLAFYPNLTELKLDNNLLLRIDGHCIKCLKKLKVFSLNTNRILRLTQNTFSDLPALTDLILRNLHGNLQIEKYAFNNSNVQYISITSGGIHFKSAVHKDAFRGCTNIESLDVSYNVFFKASGDDLDAWFGHLTSLTGFGLGGCNVNQFPLFIPLKLKRLRYLKLYENVMEEIPSGAFKPLLNLTHLWLSSNYIAKLDEAVFPQEVRDRLQEISLMYNPFACNCDLLWFLQWTKSDPRKFVNYPKKYVCDSPGEMKGKNLSKVDLTEYTCLLPLSVSLIITGCTGVFLLVLITVSLIYRWRWHIRYYIYLKKKERGEFRQILPEEIVYDAYVIYSFDDIRWIKNELIPNLEGVHNKKLYIRDRDSLAGDPFVDNIVNNMAASRNILVVLSNAMARNEECQFELMFVQRQEVGERSPIVLMLLEEIQANNVTQSVYALVKMHSYITWSEERNASDLFWNRLNHSLQTVQDTDIQHHGNDHK